MNPFCKYLQQEVVDDNRMVYMSKLLAGCLKIVEDINDDDISNYKLFLEKHSRVYYSVGLFKRALNSE